MGGRVKVRLGTLHSGAVAACRLSGAHEAMARSLADATVSAIRSGVEAVGLAHLFDYLESLRAGRIKGAAVPEISQPLPAFIRIDADHGIAQLGFDRAYDRFKAAASTCGVALLTQSNSFTAGELGYYVRRLANDGFAALSCANGPPLLAAAAGSPSVYCTNPLAFAAPVAAPLPPLVIDQASSAAAFVSILRAAQNHETIPEGWAIDGNGAPTTDPAAAILGSLLPFGGARGANIALMVEFLAAGLSGAAWSLDAGSFRTGTRAPDIGHMVLAIAPAVLGADFPQRAAQQIERLRSLGVHVPGARSCTNDFDENGFVDVARADLARLASLLDWPGLIEET